MLMAGAAALAGAALSRSGLAAGVQPTTRPTSAAIEFGPGPYAGLPMGIQSYTLRSMDLLTALKTIKNDLQLSFVELYPGHVVGLAPTKVKSILADHGLTPSSFGVVPMGKNDGNNRKYFEFAQELGMPHLTISPTPDAFDSLDKLTEEFKVTADIHDHGPGDRWAKINTILEALKDHSKWIGLCDDTGHFIRAGENPLRAAEDFGKRMHGVHLKDFKNIGAAEKPKWQDCALGDGGLKLDYFIEYLLSIGYRGSLSLEYEGGDPVNVCKGDLEKIQKIVAAFKTKIESKEK